MSDRLCRLTVDVFELEEDVKRHRVRYQFFGESEDDAECALFAHCEQDKFLRQAFKRKLDGHQCGVSTKWVRREKIEESEDE